MEHDAALEEDTPMEPRRERPAWVRTARLTFLHHARGDWLLPLSLLTFVGPIVLLAALVGSGSLVPGRADGWAVFSGLHGVLPVAMPVMLLLMTLTSFRGAWLLDPEAPADRLGGFLAGTLAALLVAFVPWALMGVVLAALLGDPLGGLLAAPAHLAALLLHAGAWVSLFLLVGVATRDADRRWVGAGVAWAAFGPVLGHVREAALSLWRFREAAPFEVTPWWGHALVALSPSESYVALSRMNAGAVFPLDGNAPLAAGILLAWVALPLALAVVLQKRRAD